MKYFTLLLIFITNFSFAQNVNEFYSGQIGKYPIVMLLSHRPNSNHEAEYSCSYLYKSQGIIIEVDEVEFKSNVLTLTLNYDEMEKFILRPLADKSWKGTWQNKNGKPSSVNLKPLNINSINHKMGHLQVVKDWKKDNGLLYIATSNLIFKQDTITYAGKVPIYWFKDNIYGTSFFRLDAKYKKINEILLKEHLGNISLQAEGYHGDGEEEKSFEVENLNDSVLSFYHGRGMFYCFYSGRPFWRFDSGTFDLKLDKELEFDEMFAFSDKPVIYKENNSKEWYKYKEEKVAPKMVAILRKSHPELKETPKNYERKDDGECYFLNNEMWKNLKGWSISKKGLYLQHFDSSGAYGYGPCINSFYVPFIYLKSYIISKYKPYLK